MDYAENKTYRVLVSVYTVTLKQMECIMSGDEINHKLRMEHFTYQAERDCWILEEDSIDVIIKVAQM